MKLKQIGIDIGKNTFHLIGLGLDGDIALRKQFTRTRLIEFFKGYVDDPSGWLLRPVRERTGWPTNSSPWATRFGS